MTFAPMLLTKHQAKTYRRRGALPPGANTKGGLMCTGIRILVVALLMASGCGGAGPAGTSCVVKDNGDGSKTLTCGDGTIVTVHDGTNGAPGTNGMNGIAGMNGADGKNG